MEEKKIRSTVIISTSEIFGLKKKQVINICGSLHIIRLVCGCSLEMNMAKKINVEIISPRKGHNINCYGDLMQDELN